MSLANDAGGRPLTGRKFLAILVGCFAVVLVVNVTMAYYAISTFSGLDGDDSYKRGLDYNQTLAEAGRQDALGWKTSFAVPADGKSSTLSVLDKAGSPVTGLAISGTLTRPSTNQFDRTATFKEAAPGQYSASFAAPLDKGGWIAEVSASGAALSSAQLPRYQLRQRLWLN